MNLDSLFEYLIPLAVLILYFLVSMRKKPTQSRQREEFQKEQPTRWAPPPKAPKRIQDLGGLPPVHRGQETFHSKIEDRKVASSINTREYSSMITGRQGPVSSEMLKHLDNDPAYEQKVKTGISRAKKLFQNKGSVRNAVLLQEILRRPYE